MATSPHLAFEPRPYDKNGKTQIEPQLGDTRGRCSFTFDGPEPGDVRWAVDHQRRVITSVTHLHTGYNSLTDDPSKWNAADVASVQSSRGRDPVFYYKATSALQKTSNELSYLLVSVILRPRGQHFGLRLGLGLGIEHLASAWPLDC